MLIARFIAAFSLIAVSWGFVFLCVVLVTYFILTLSDLLRGVSGMSLTTWG